MFSARNTGDVWPLSYAGLLGFLRRVGSRVKRILFPRHYVIAARVAVQADRRYISAVGEEREFSFSRRFFSRQKLSSLVTRARDEISRFTKGALRSLRELGLMSFERKVRCSRKKKQWKHYENIAENLCRLVYFFKK